MGDTYLNLMSDALQKLKCSFCKRLLSVGPVFSISEVEERYKCGRCADIECKFSIKNFCYERVARFVAFPCFYEGCNVKLPFGQMEKHEKFCPYRTVQCITLGCSFQVRVNELANHLKVCKLNKDEKKVYTKYLANFCVTPYEDKVAILKKNPYKCIIIILFNSNYMYAGMFSLYELSENVSFRLKVAAKDSINSSIHFQNNIIEYDESVHCINCMRKQCELCHHKYSLSKDKCGENISELPIQINFDLCNELLLHPSEISYEVAIENV